MAVLTTAASAAPHPVPESDDRYKWVALANTTAAVFMSALDGSIVIIALPAIFRGIHLDPLAPGNIGYLLWMIMGYRLVQAVLVVTVGRLGDMFGRVRIYNAGFAVFTVASVLLSFDPFVGGRAATWLIGWRVLQAAGGSMLQANSTAILTDAFPSTERGFALGTNQVAALAGQFIGLVAGGLLAALDWRAVFWVNVPVGIFGTWWAYTRLRETSKKGGGRIDWWGNITFAIGLSAILIAVTYGIQPYGGHAMGWTNPFVVGLLAGGILLLAAFTVIETRVAEPLIQLSLFRIRTFTAGSVAAFVVAVARGGLQFVLIIWLQGIWLPLHGYNYSETPLWAGIFMLPLTAGFLISGPLSGRLSDRFGPRGFATAGMVVFGGSFIGLIVIPVDFSYWAFAVLTFANGIGSGMFSAPNTSSLMSAVPASQRGAASGMRAMFQNSGTALSIGVFFSVMIAGLADSLPHSLTSGLQQQGVSHALAERIGSLPPVSSLFAATLGVNPLQHLLAVNGALSALSSTARQVVTGREFFPHLISGPFHEGLVIVFALAAGLSALAAIASQLRGGHRPATAVTSSGTQPGPEGLSPACDPPTPPPPTNQQTTKEKRHPVANTTLDPMPALVIIDLQKGLMAIPTVHPISEVVARAAHLAGAFRRHQLPVVLVNATGRAPGRTEADPTRNSGFTPSSDWADLVDELDTQPADLLVTKETWGAFHNTSLDTRLRELGVTQVVLAGVSTSAGVESTARSAYEHGYNVVLVTDAMTDRDPLAHENSVDRIFPKLGETAGTDEILDLLDRTR